MFSANASQVSNDVKYIEDFCSVYLRTGTGSSQTVTTGVKENTGALVISKSRSAATDWAWYDTFRGATKELASNTTAAEITQSQGLTSFNTDGHTWGTLAKVNTSGATYVDFVLKPTPKFFDVVTWTGNNANPRVISHNLGSVPGSMFIKATSTTGDWFVYHRSFDGSLRLNTTAAGVGGQPWYRNDFTSTTISVTDTINATGVTYVAYLFAHNAGGFGLTGTDNVISCGAFTTDSFGNAEVEIGYEPQWVLTKCSSGTGDWKIGDSVRGMPYPQAHGILYPNSSVAEQAGFQVANSVTLSSTKFGVSSDSANSTFIYVAIRKGPMKLPTSGLQVFTPVAYTGNGASQTISFGNSSMLGFDVSIHKARGTTAFSNLGVVNDSLRGFNKTTPNSQSGKYLATTNTDAEGGGTPYQNPTLTQVSLTSGMSSNTNGATFVTYFYRRFPGFFDEVCYTGNSVDNRTIPHNLTVAPELTIIKMRSGDTTRGWRTYTPNAVGSAKWGMLNLTNAFESAVYIPSVSSTIITLSNDAEVNRNACNYVAYLFASCPGVQSIQSYVGDGTTGRTINCGFTGGARFVCIKATSTTGSWWTFDSARGITTNADPVLQLNSTAAEITSADAIDPAASGFIVNQEATCSLNASGVSYLVWAIA